MHAAREQIAFNSGAVGLSSAASKAFHKKRRHAAIINIRLNVTLGQFCRRAQPERLKSASEALLRDYPGVAMKRRILLVDDEAAILLTLKAILELNGFEVETAASSQEAITKLTSDSYHMVITDMKMETETAGYDVIRVAKQQEYDPATAILTAFPTLGSDWQSRGVEKLLVKPVGTDELLRQLEVMLIRHEDVKQQKRARAAVAPKSRSGAKSKVAS